MSSNKEFDDIRGNENFRGGYKRRSDLDQAALGDARGARPDPRKTVCTCTVPRNPETGGAGIWPGSEKPLYASARGVLWHCAYSL
jgi:hypothetical protein